MECFVLSARPRNHAGNVHSQTRWRESHGRGLFRSYRSGNDPRWQVGRRQTEFCARLQKAPIDRDQRWLPGSEAGRRIHHRRLYSQMGSREEMSHRQSWNRARNSSLKLKLVTSVNVLNVPASLISFAASIKPVQAARANTLPTEMRRTPRSASCETVRLQFFIKTRTLTGFGATAFTIAAISSGLVTPGA